MKHCKVCHNLKALDDFYRDTYSKDGHLGKCKSCTSNQMAQYRKNNLKKVRQQGRSNSQKYRDITPYDER